MDNRFPGLGTECRSFILDKEHVVENLTLLYECFLNRRPSLGIAVQDLCDKRDRESLIKLCGEIYQLIPMQEGEDLNPLITTQEQIDKYLAGEVYGIGDCKLLSIFTTFVCSTLCNLNIVISIRSYSGHPVLYIDLDGTPFKISFLHENPEIKEFHDDNPFKLSKDEPSSTAFNDMDYNNSTSILYWRVRDAIFILDCMNLLRRSVVNYVYNPITYEVIFETIVTVMEQSGIFYKPVVNYWQSEFERIKEIYNDGIYFYDYTNPESLEKFKKVIIKSLRFNT